MGGLWDDLHIFAMDIMTIKSDRIHIYLLNNTFMNKQAITLLFMLPVLTAGAQNPIIRGIYAADPTARVFNDKVYVYPSHDIMPPEGQRQDWFCMADYHVFSSENLTDWTDHGMIISQENVPWGNPEGYSMWAPDCVYKDGKYYFYFPDAPKEGRGFAIGVATADSPEGPFVCEPEPIKGVMGIDPCVLVDNDGQAYIYWSGMGIRGAKLKANMKELDGELTELRFPGNANAQAPNMPPILVGGQAMEGLPEGFKEGPFAFRRGDWYYLTFPWVRGDTSNGQNPTETLAYSMSRSPLGPWDFKGIIMAEHDNTCWTNHHSIVEYKGQWYIFYHRNDYSPSDDKRRSARVEKIAFNDDGTIQEVFQTKRGVGISQATSVLQPDRYSAASDDVSVAYVDTLDRFQGWQVSLPKPGSWLCYGDVDFSGVTKGNAMVRVKACADAEFSLREGSTSTGTVIARFKVKGGKDASKGEWMTLTAPLEYTPKGVTDLVITCELGAVDIDWVQF